KVHKGRRERLRRRQDASATKWGRTPAGCPSTSLRTSQRYEMGEEGRQDANADSRLPRFPVFVSCNPGNSARVAIEDGALKGRRYKGKRKNKEDGGLPWLPQSKKGRRCNGERKNKR